VKICYYNRLLNEPRGCGVHGRGLVDNWRRQGHEVLCLPQELVPPGPRAESGVRNLSSLPPLARTVAHELSARIRAAKGASRLSELIIDYAPEMLVTRRAGYDYCLDGVLSRSALPYIVEGNGIVSLETREFGGEWVLPWERTWEIDYLRQAAGVVCVTSEVRAQMSAVGVSEGKTAVLPNGVDAQLFSPGVPPNETTAAWSQGFRSVFCFVGSQQSSHYDLAGLLGIAGQLAAQEADAGFLFVGPTRSEIESASTWRSDLADRVHCTGRVSHSDVPSHLVCADVFWAALLHDYGSPLKLYEYMAMARPVVLAGAGEAVEVVQASRCGKAVDRGDDQGLLTCALDLCRASDEQRREMGENGRTWIMNGHTWADVAARFVEVGTAMLGRA
jgi:glycosyltransferase involved in cell wall biosynthesis